MFIITELQRPGSTDGIGKAIAAQLAAQKINLLLISRSADKLAATSQELKDKYSVRDKL